MAATAYTAALSSSWTEHCTFFLSIPLFAVFSPSSSSYCLISCYSVIHADALFTLNTLLNEQNLLGQWWLLFVWPRWYPLKFAVCCSVISRPPKCFLWTHWHTDIVCALFRMELVLVRSQKTHALSQKPVKNRQTVDSHFRLTAKTTAAEGKNLRREKCIEWSVYTGLVASTTAAAAFEVNDRN